MLFYLPSHADLMLEMTNAELITFILFSVIALPFFLLHTVVLMYALLLFYC